MLNSILFCSALVCTIFCFVLTIVSKIKLSIKLNTASIYFGVGGISIIVMRFLFCWMGVI